MPEGHNADLLEPDGPVRASWAIRCHRRNRTRRAYGTHRGNGTSGPAGLRAQPDPQGLRDSPGQRAQPAQPGRRGPSGTAAFGTNTQEAVAGTGAECTLGEVILSAGPVANGVPANGQLLPIDQYEALFSLLGTTYGGDGITTFALPNLGAAAPNGLTYSICVVGVFPSRS